MLTTQEFSEIFEIKFNTTSNERVFENEKSTLTLTKTNDKDFIFRLDFPFGDAEDMECIYSDAEFIRDFINTHDYEFKGFSEDQRFEIDMSNMPDAEPIVESTYTCKNGYTMKTYLIDFEELCAFDKSKEYDLENLVKSLKGWYDYRKKNIVLRSRKDAQKVVDFIYA